MPETIEILQKITDMQKEQALQGLILQQISQQTVIQATQTATLLTDVMVIKTEVATWRVEINTINSWRADSSTLFIPRKEHEAARHEARITALEQLVLTNAQDKADETRLEAAEKHGFTEWIVNNGMSILFFLIMLTLTLMNYLKH